jgi:hypothetical protein
MEFFIESVCRSDVRFEVKKVKVLHALLYLSASHHVKASVTYACKQIALSCLFSEMTRIVEELGKDVVNHILALSIVVQKYGGQSIHLAVMLSEQRLELVSICHTPLYTHEHTIY